jgi:multiple sugar transport system permease protein
VMTFIAGVQGGFEQAKVMTDGKPAGTTISLAYYIYIKAFEEFQMGYASAIAWLMFAIIFAMTLTGWKFGAQAVEDL